MGISNPLSSNIYAIIKVYRNTFIIDINECATDTHLCTQNCTNTNGSYICDCTSGYQLNEDGFQCDGMSENVCLAYQI